MAKFAQRKTAAPAKGPLSPVTTVPARAGAAPPRTFNGAPGYERDPKSALFLLAVTNMVGERTFYEGADERDTRFRDLVRLVAVEDGAWLAGFIPWLRDTANMRSASVVAAAEAVYARLYHAHATPPLPDGVTLRGIVASALQRPDEPAEMLAYWRQRYGRALPKPIKRGVADALVRMVNEKQALRYDGAGKVWRLGDVIDTVKPTPKAPWQSALFRFLLDSRHGRPSTTETLAALPMIRERLALEAIPVAGRRAVLSAAPERLAEGGYSWESLSGWLQGPMDREAWEAIIPSMGYMALLRNLRNFDEAKVSDEVAAQVAARLADAEEVARSRQFPLRFLSAYRAAPSLRWSWPLEQAVHASLANVPALAGRTLYLVDTSGSMDDPLSARSDLRRWDAAVLFALALAMRGEQSTVVSYSRAGYWNGRSYPDSLVFPLTAGESLLAAFKRWEGPGGGREGSFHIGAGTDTGGAVQRHYAGHDRIVLLTDEQTDGYARHVFTTVPAHVPTYTWSLGGYRVGHAPSGAGNRHTFSGLTDAAFRMVALLESGTSAGWPWEGAAAPATPERRYAPEVWEVATGR